MRIPSGKTDQLIFFVALDSADNVTRKTGLSSFTVYRSRNGGTATIYTTPTVAELSSANMPGVYALTVDEDTTIASGSDSEEYCVHITATGMAPVTRTIELYRRDVTSGQTAAVDSSGRVDVGKIGGTAQTARDIGASVLVGDKTGFKLASDGLSAVTAWTVAITGNITGNLSGSVGSVTGSVGGNVTGSVGSISGVTFPTNFAALGIGADGHILTVDTLTTYTGNTPQTGDTYARIGAAGAGLTALGDARVAHLDADVSSRLAGASYTAPDNTGIAAIQAKTDNLPSDPADQSLVIAATTAIYDRIGAPAGLSVSADIAAVKAVDDAVKAKTDNLPASPAATGDAMTLTAAYDAAKTAASQTSVDDLPTNAELAAALAGADDATLAAIAALPTAATVDAIKAKTDSLTFTAPGKVDANIKAVNDAAVAGSGTSGAPWGPA